MSRKRMKSGVTVHRLNWDPFQRCLAEPVPLLPHGPRCPPCSPARLHHSRTNPSVSRTNPSVPSPTFFAVGISPRPSSPPAPPPLSREPSTSCPGTPTPKLGSFREDKDETVLALTRSAHEYPLSLSFLTAQASSHRFSLPSSLNTDYSIGNPLA